MSTTMVVLTQSQREALIVLFRSESAMTAREMMNAQQVGGSDERLRRTLATMGDTMICQEDGAPFPRNARTIPQDARARLTERGAELAANIMEALHPSKGNMGRNLVGCGVAAKKAVICESMRAGAGR